VEGGRNISMAEGNDKCFIEMREGKIRKGKPEKKKGTTHTIGKFEDLHHLVKSHRATERTRSERRRS